MDRKKITDKEECPECHSKEIISLGTGCGSIGVIPDYGEYPENFKYSHKCLGCDCEFYIKR